MTLDRVKATGSGTLEFRLVIEGLPYQAVSHPDMEIRRPKVRGESGFSASDYYSHADGVLEGSTSMVRVCMFRCDGTPAADEFLFSVWPTLSTGWGLYVNTSRQVVWRVENTTVTSGAVTIGETNVVVAMYDGANIQLWLNASSAGTAALTGSVGTGSFGLAIGARGDTGDEPAATQTILACAASDSVSTVGDAGDYWEACKAAGDLARFDGVESLWSVRRAGSLRLDRVGSVDMTLHGSLTDTGLFRADYSDEDGRERIAGIDRDGSSLVLSEELVIPESDIEVGSMAFALVESQPDLAWTKAFAYQPDVTTWLTADASKTDTTLTVADTSGLSAGDVIHIGTEAIKIGTVASSTSLTGCTRGYWDTVAQAHWTRDEEKLSYPPVTNRPFTLERRRAYLYLYGDGDVDGDGLTGDGTLKWTGVCLTAAELDPDASTWSIVVDSIIQLYDQDFGTDLKDPVTPRGIYYPATAPLIIEIEELDATNPRTATAISNRTEITIVGFFETQADFIAEVNSQLASEISGWSVDDIWAAGSAVGWELRFRAGTTARWLNFHISSLIDARDMSSAGAVVRVLGTSPATQAFSITASAEYFVEPRDPGPPGAGGVPRGVYGRDATTFGVGSVSDSDLATYYPERIYLGGTVDPTDIDGVSIEVPGGAGAFEGTFPAEVKATDASDRFVDFRERRGPSGGKNFVYTPLLLPTLHFTRSYATGGLADLIQALTAVSQDEANKGTVPFVVPNVDIEPFAVYSAAISAAESGRPWTQRRWIGTGEELNFKELLQQACMSRGLFMRLDAQGRVSFSSIATPVASAVASFSADEDELLEVSGWPTWKKNAEGNINNVLVETGFNADTGKHEGIPVVVRDVASISRLKATKTLEIAEPSEPLADLPSFADIEELVQPVFGIWGGEYALITVEVPFTLFDIRCGDLLALTCSTLPNVDTGERGLTSKASLVTGRRWNLDDCYGELDLLASFERFAGYAPSVSVSSATGSGTSWTLTVSTASPDGLAGYFPTGSSLSDFFADGYAIKLRQWNSTSPVIRTGTIDVGGVDDAAMTLDVTLDSSWAGPGGNDFVVGFGDAPDVTVDQQIFAFLGGTSLTVSFPTTKPAFKYSS